MVERSLEIAQDDDYTVMRPTRARRAPCVSPSVAVVFGDEPTLESPKWPSTAIAEAEDELTCLLPTKAILPPPPVAHARRPSPPLHSLASFDAAVGTRASMRSETGLTRFDARSPAARVGSSPPPAAVIDARRNAFPIPMARFQSAHVVAHVATATAAPTKKPRAMSAFRKVLALATVAVVAVTASTIAPGGPQRLDEAREATTSFASVVASEVVEAGGALGLTERHERKRVAKQLSARTAPLPRFALHRGAFPPAS